MDKILLLSRVTNLVTENMGQESGKMFYAYHERSDVDTIISDGKALIGHLMGPVATERQFKDLVKEL